MSARRLRTLVIGALAATICAGASQSAAGPAQPQRPNVVVVMTDDQTLASMAQMPTVRAQLAAQGATFANTFSNWPLCCPSRATFYTGQYAHNHRVIGNSPPQGGFTAFADANTLPVWLRQTGYRTIHVGKYLNGYGQDGGNQAYVPPGWDEWHAATGPTTQTVYGYTLNRNSALVGYGNTAADFKQDVFTEIAVDAINRNAPGGPFFLGVMYTAPHSGGPQPNVQPPNNCQASAKPAPRHATAFDSAPLPQPPNFNEADVSDKPLAVRNLEPISTDRFNNAQRRYRCRIESLQSVDEGVGRILAALSAASELDNTIVIFTSDNGFFAGEHRVQVGKNRIYEEAIRVPLVIRGPGVPEGVTVEDLAINADLAPTVLDAAEGTAGLTMDGRSLLPAAAHPDRLSGRELLIEKSDVDDGDDDGGPTSGTFNAVRTSRYVYAEHGTGEVELYDLTVDPYELQNQAQNPAYDAIEAGLATRLAPLRSCAGESCQRKPDLQLRLPPKVMVNGRPCHRAQGFVAEVRGSGATRVIKVSFAVGSRPAGTDTSAPFTKTIPAELLREGGPQPEIRAVAEMLDGRVLSLQKHAQICP